MAKTLNTFIERLKTMVDKAEADASGNIKMAYKITEAALKAAIRHEDVYICPVCGSELINKKCPKGHKIVW